MKKKYFIFAALLIVSIGLSATAQAADESKVIAHIPFDFIVAGKNMPAGTYTVSRLSSGPVLLVSSQNAGVLVVPLTLHSSDYLTPALLFDKVADTYVLREVGTPIGAFIIDTHREVTRLVQLQQHGRMTSSGGN